VSYQKLGREFQTLRVQYRRGMPDKLARVEKLWSLVSTSKAVGPPLRELCRELHTIAGSAGTYGLPQLSEAALAAETHLIASATVGEEGRQQMARLLAELKNASLPPS
jgi:HPt (histidine-containing phosphotransfer) domain-containing protein